jgi:hypothetical protein
MRTEERCLTAGAGAVADGKPLSTLRSSLTRISVSATPLLPLLACGYSQDMKALSQAVAEAGFVQYASHASKMEIQEFVHFAKVRWICRSAFGCMRLHALHVFIQYPARRTVQTDLFHVSLATEGQRGAGILSPVRLYPG